MNWTAALSAMRAGHDVLRKSEHKMTPLTPVNGVPVFLVEREPMRLVAAWSCTHGPVSVFMNATSRTLAVPRDDDLTATDWEIVG